jgi:hypothetical protein
LLNNFNIVLFKNNKKKKLIKTFITQKKATERYKTLLDKNKTIYFEKKVENAEYCDFYLAIVTNQKQLQKTLVIKDELGRNKVVDLEDPDFIFLDFQPYKIEELIFDWQTKKKIKFLDFIKKYCASQELKSIYCLNNKVCVQINEDVNMFSLKDKYESDRFLGVVENYFIENDRNDALFIRDVSIAQRKWVYEILVDKGFDKSYLYRLKTTFSKK